MAKKKKLIVAVIVISLFAVMSLCGMAVAGQQAMDRSDFHGSEDNVIDRAAIIDEENSMLVGKEVEDTTPLTATKGMKGTPGIVQDTKSNEIVKSFADEVVEPINITNFETTDNVTPEVIVPNGSAAIFSQAGGTGWICNDGDELIYRFEKFPSEFGAQTLVIGYILDGVMYPGEKYLVEDGEYRHKIDKSGEYFVYVINASSDPLSLKSGDICN